MTKIKIKQGDKANLPTLDTAELACVDDKKELWMGTSGGNVHVGGGGSLSTLIGEYHFDEDSGTTAYDTSGYGYDGTLINSPSRVTGKYGKALQFDETNKYVNCATTSGIDFSGAFSIAFWFKTTMGGASNPGTIISKIDNIPSGKGWAFLLYDHEPGCLSLFVQENASNYKGWATTALYNDGLWHHAVGVKYADNTLKIYVDGEETAGHYVEAGTVTDYSNSETIKIGAEGVITHTFAGAIDEVHIYKRVLYAAEIANLYEFGDYLIIGQYPSYGDYGIIRNKLDTSATAIWGGNDDKGAGIYLWGKNHAGYAGDIEFVVPNAAGTILQTILRLEGKTDTPYLNAYKPLHIDDITEKTSGHGVALDCDLDMGNTHLAGHDILNAQWIYGPSGDNGFVAIVGGISNTNSAAVIAYGPDFAGANGAIYMAVPNAAKNAVLDVIDITGATDSPVVNFHYPLNIDTINEYTADAGVTIDGCLIRDSVLNILDSSIERQGDNNGLALVGGADVASIITLYGKNAGYHPGGIDFEVTNAAKNDITIAMEILGNTDTPSVDIQHALKTDTIDEISEGAGVTIDGVLLKDGTLTFMDLYVDHIGEKTANAGVTIDGLVCKDHYLWLTNDTSELRIKGGTHVDASPHIYMLGKDIGYGDPGSIGFATTNIAGDDTELMLTLSGRDVNPLIRAYEKIQADVGIATNTIAERTTGYGVTIEELIIGSYPGYGDYGIIRNKLDTSATAIWGGNDDKGAGIYLWGKNHAGYAGDIEFVVPNAAGTILQTILRLEGKTDTPYLNAYKPLHIDDITEKTSGHGVALDCDLDMGNTHLAGHDILNAQWIYGPSGDNGFVAIVGGISNTNSAAVIAYGPDFAGANGAIYMAVPNAAKNAVLDVIDITGATDSPVVNFHYPLNIDTINEYTADAGVTIDGCLIRDSVLNILDSSIERQGDNNGLALVGGADVASIITLYGKNAGYHPGGIDFEVTNAAKNDITIAMEILGNTDTPSVDIQHALKTDTIDEISEGAGVTIDGVLLKDGTLTFMDLYVDHIGEKTANAGVTIDGLVCKDHYLWLTNDTSELRIKGGTHVDASPHIYMLGKDIGYGDPGSIGFATTNIAGDDTELMLTLSGRDVNPLIRAYEKIQADVGIATNTIAERTTGYGVTIEELIIGSYPGYGDYGIIRNKLDTTATAIWGGNDDKGAGIYLWGKNHAGYAGDIEFVVPNGAGTLLKTVLRIEGKTDNPYLNAYKPLHIDTINEKTTDAGVTIDGCLIKDGVVASPVAATIIVAASNSLHKERADYTCSGANDDAIINTAISALPANGGTIILLDGLYVIEDVILITKSNVTLKGMGCGATILETPSSLPAKIEAIIKAETKNYIYIQSMTISGGSAYKTNTGILFNTVSKSKVSDCGFEYSANVHLFSSTNRVLVTNNDFVVSAQLNLYNATYNTIKDNHSRMIHMDHSNYNLIENNIGYQIYLYYSDKNVITHNHTGSTAADIELQYSSSNIITNNILSGQHSIIIRLSSRYNKIDNNQCTPTYRAIYIYDQSYYNTVTNNHVTGGSHYGIYMKGASYCIIANNICCGWGSRGIMIEGGDYSVIKGNICKDNGTDGIILYNHADNNIVSNNQCSGNIDVGIMLEENNDDNTIIGNHCYNNDKDGILLFQSSHNIVEGNFCKDNGQDTLYSYSEIRIWGYSGVGSHHNLITNNKCRCTAATKCDYCIKEDLSIDDYNKITDNCVDGATTAQILTVGTHTVVHDNMGHNGVMDYGTF